MDAVRFVLVRPEHGSNIGAAARALKNTGFSDLRLVEPRDYDLAAAERVAHGAEDVLAAARRAESLGEAVGDCRWVVAASRRSGRHRAIEWTPRDLAAAMHATPERRPAAIVFGPEADGLSAADLELCQDMVRIPSSPAQPSYNLAQAVVVVAYELFVASRRGRPRPCPPLRPSTDEEEATTDELAAFYAHLESMLLTVGFARDETAPARMVALRRIFGRARLRRAEVSLLRGIWRQAAWAADRDRPV